MNSMKDIWELRRIKFLTKKYKDILPSYSDDEINKIISNNIISRIESFYLKYSFCRKSFFNFNNLEGKSLIKIRSKNKIIGYHPTTLEKHFDLNGYYDIETSKKYKKFIYKCLIRKLKHLSPYKVDKSYEKYQQIEYYINKINEKEWEFDDILNILETRGLNKISVPEDVFNSMIDLDPGVYAIEFINDDLKNINKAYCSFEDYPSEDDYFNLPLNVLTQLRTNQINNVYYKIVKPLKGKSVKLKCFINPLDKFNNIKEQLQLEFTKHKFISVNQIISIESDVNHSLVPFLITETYPSNIVDVTDIDLEITFDENFGFENEYEALLIYLNS
tara:strand:+ start:3138 stop:4130 length:993 start_codon:yes stop_codon:yes gene_type:complete